MARSRAAIITASTTVFLEHGYTGATVDRVAEVAGVAKRTVYNLYADKDELFRATVLNSIHIADGFSAALAADVHAVEDPRAELPELAVRLAESVLVGSVLPLRRLLVMESARFPELAAEYRVRAPEAVMKALSELFRRLSSAGRLRPCEPIVAAQHFAFLAMGADLDRGMFVSEAPTLGHVRARARAGAEVFLRAYLAE